MLKNTEIEVAKRVDGKFNVWALLGDKQSTTDKRWVVVDVITRPGDASRFNGNGNKLTYINK